MDFIKELEYWSKGDALQGRVMLMAGIITGIALIFIFKSNSSMLKGTIIPLSLLLVLCVGYGGFLAYSRPIHLQTIVKELTPENSREIIQKELSKSAVDNKTYATLKPIWAVLIAVCLVLFFVFSNEYYKGLSIGLIGMFFAVFVIDTFLHHRLTPYLKTLQELIAQ